MDIIQYIAKHSSDFIVILSVFGVALEVTPIKINPLSSVLKFIGKKINEETNENVSKLVLKIENVEKELYANKKKQYSLIISNFASDLRHGIIKSESQYIAMLELCDEYLANGWNGKIKLDSIFIREEYMRVGEKVKNGEYKIKGGD